MAFFGRGKNKIKNPYNLSDIYEFYLNQVGNNSLYKVEKSEYVEIVGDYYKAIVEYVLEGGRFKLPFKLGELYIIKRKVDFTTIKSMTPDWALTNKVGKKVFHLNEHSGGFKYLFYWNKTYQILKNLYFYRLVLTRTNKRKLAKLIKECGYDYFEKN